MRYTVGYCLYPHGKDDSIETPIRILQICFPKLTLAYFIDLIEQKIVRREYRCL